MFLEILLRYLFLMFNYESTVYKFIVLNISFHQLILYNSNKIWIFFKSVYDLYNLRFKSSILNMKKIYNDFL